MKPLLFCLIFLSLAGCGGGSPAPEIPEAAIASKIFKTKVIDGYISGANIFIDNNWNLQQDSNEPSAYEDTDNQTYYFLEEDFSGIDSWSIDCSQKRPRIAQVPLGALDSVRGDVTSAYELYYLPYFSEGAVGEQGEYRANITPLTTLFLPFITEELDGINIDDVDGCGPAANAVATNVLSKVDNVLNELSLKFSIDVFTFYDDFIASGDSELQAYGEVIVDFLKIAFAIGRVIEEEYQSNSRVELDKLSVETILARESFDTMTYNFFSQGEYIDLEDDYIEFTLYGFYGVSVNSVGEPLNSEGDTYVLTLENLKLNSNFLVREIMISKNALFADNRVLFEKKQTTDAGIERLIHFSQFSPGDLLYEVLENEALRRVGIVEVVDGRLHGLQVYFNNPANNYFNYDLETIFTTRDAIELEAIWNEVTLLQTDIATIDQNRYLLLPSDNQVLQKHPWSYVERYVDIPSPGVEKRCLNTETEIEYMGEEAYAVCLEGVQAVE